MHITRLVAAEIAGRPLSFLLCLSVVATAAILFIAGPTILSGYAEDTKQQLRALEQETDAVLAATQAETDTMLAEMDKKTTRIMRDLGVNLRIVHRDTTLGSLYTDFVAVDFPEEYVQKLANAPQIETIVHLIATLQEKIKWNGRTVLLIGMFPVLTASQKNAEMPHMAQPVEPGTVVVGSELAAGLTGDQLAQFDVNQSGTLDAGDVLEVLGTNFRVAEVRPEKGGIEDVQLILDLHDAQQLTGKVGRIHQIMALNCKCKGNRLSVIRRELEGVLPDTKVTEQVDRATAREEQRNLVEQKRAEQLLLLKTNREQQTRLVQAKREQWERTLEGLIGVMLPLVVFVAGVIVGCVMWLNVRERRSEIGLLRALGKRTSQIAALFLYKAVLIGLLGGLLAVLVALAASMAWPESGGPLLDGSLTRFRPSSQLLLLAILGAPVVTTMASYLPMLAAVAQDPARILTEN
ncbi:MAG: FtsX-like permease family protein [Pirellulaceae bacterium]